MKTLDITPPRSASVEGLSDPLLILDSVGARILRGFMRREVYLQKTGAYPYIPFQNT